MVLHFYKCQPVKKELGLGLTSIHWSVFIGSIHKSYQDTGYNTLLVQYCIVDTRSEWPKYRFFFSCCLTITHNTVYRYLCFKSHLLSCLLPPPTPHPTPHFVVYCCGPVRLRSKHTWSLSLARTLLLLLLHHGSFHCRWTFLWCLRTSYSYFCLIQFVGHCLQKCD